MSTATDNPTGAVPKRPFGWLHITLFLLAAVVLTTIATVWIVTIYIFPSEFKPVKLSAKEEQTLSVKLERLGALGTDGRYGRKSSAETTGDAPTPEHYTEEGASRGIVLKERELNALLAKNTDFASKLAIDLADDLISAKLLVPIDEDFPFVGGQTLKVRAGVEMAYSNGRPIVVLKGVSVMGVPLPNSWMGGIKNIDLVKEFGGRNGFWKAFADGVEDIRVEEGQLRIKLKQ